MAQSKMKIKMIGSAAGGSKRQKETLKGLGFTKLQQVKEVVDNACTRGMVNKIPHLVVVVKS